MFHCLYQSVVLLHNTCVSVMIILSRQRNLNSFIKANLMNSCCKTNCFFWTHRNQSLILIQVCGNFTLLQWSSQWLTWLYQCYTTKLIKLTASLTFILFKWTSFTSKWRPFTTARCNASRETGALYYSKQHFFVDLQATSIFANNCCTLQSRPGLLT